MIVLMLFHVLLRFLIRNYGVQFSSTGTRANDEKMFLMFLNGFKLILLVFNIVLLLFNVVLMFYVLIVFNLLNEI